MQLTTPSAVRSSSNIVLSSGGNPLLSRQSNVKIANPFEDQIYVVTICYACDNIS